MPVLFPLPRYVVYTKTATNDAVFQVVLQDTWLKEADIFVTTNDAYCGATAMNQEIIVYANDVYTPKGIVNAKDFYFKNKTAGSNCVVAIAGVCLSEAELKGAGII